MAKRRSYRVKEVAQIAGVSVRALHHYDEIGLLVPKQRSAAGYRLYQDDDLLRLQQILIGRELGLPLEQIRRSLDDPGFDRKAALIAQKKQLEQRAEQTAAMIRAIDAALALLEPTQTGASMTDKSINMDQIFDGFDPTKYEAEAKQRWGKTDAYKESMKRTQRYTADDWERLKAEQVAIYTELRAAQQAGKQPSDEAVMEIAERHRSLIDRWFYPCSASMHTGLADLYENDARFAENIDKFGEGLTPFLAQAIRENARSNHG